MTTVDLTDEQIILFFYMYGFSYDILTEMQKKKIETVLEKLVSK